MRKLRFLAPFFLFLALFVVSFEGKTKSTWLVNPTKISSFGVKEKKALAETLERYDIKVVYDDSLNAEVLDPIPERPQSLTPLLKGKYVSVYMISPSIEELHIGLVVNDLLTLKGEALQEFNETIKGAVAAFQELGYGDYLGFCNFGKTYSFSSGGRVIGECWEMIPLGKNYVTHKNGDYQLTPKIWRNNYVLSNQTPEIKPINTKLTKQFVDLLKSYLDHHKPYPPSFSKETIPWKIRIPDWESAQQATLKRLLISLQESGAVTVVDSSTNQTPTQSPHSVTKVEGEFNVTYEKTRDKCAFCKQDLIQRQKMISDPSVVVLYNYLPYTPNAHFMVVPLQHKESWHHLENNQAADTIKWAQKVSLILGNKKSLVWFCQNGPRAGQTVPHFHMHVLHRPHPVLFPIHILNELSGNRSQPVGEKEYQCNREKICEGLKNLPQ